MIFNNNTFLTFQKYMKNSFLQSLTLQTCFLFLICPVKERKKTDFVFFLNE